MALSASGSVDSPSAVEPVTSQKRTVTVFRCSRTAVAPSSAAPQELQKRAPSGFDSAQLGHAGTELLQLRFHLRHHGQVLLALEEVERLLEGVARVVGPSRFSQDPPQVVVRVGLVVEPVRGLGNLYRFARQPLRFAVLTLMSEDERLDLPPVHLRDVIPLVSELPPLLGQRRGLVVAPELAQRAAELRGEAREQRPAPTRFECAAGAAVPLRRSFVISLE